MSIQPAICSSCGGKIKVDDVDLNGFCECEFCHTPHKVIDIITVDGLPTAKSLLSNAEFSVQDGNYEKAVNLYKEALTIKPNCHEAWWGLYLCNSYFDRYYQYEDKYGNSGPLTKASIMNNTIQKYAQRAIDYAPSDIASDYKNQIQEELHFIEQASSGAFDKKDRNGKSGCYIATAVYGSYTCNEVIALRKYRDEKLIKSFAGRLFIRVYYFISPGLSKYIKPYSYTGKIIRRLLDSKINRLQ